MLKAWKEKVNNIDYKQNGNSKNQKEMLEKNPNKWRMPLVTH